MVVMATTLTEDSSCVLAAISNFSTSSLLTRRGGEAVRGIYSLGTDYIITSVTFFTATLPHSCNEN